MPGFHGLDEMPDFKQAFMRGTVQPYMTPAQQFDPELSGVQRGFDNTGDLQIT